MRTRIARAQTTFEESRQYLPHQLLINGVLGNWLFAPGHIPIRRLLGTWPQTDSAVRQRHPKFGLESGRAVMTRRPKVLETKFQTDIRLPLLGMVTDGRHEAAQERIAESCF